MGKKVKSARGELVDFDLLKIKRQMASSPPTADVKARESFIDRRLRRRVKKNYPKANEEVTKQMPETEDLGQETKFIDEQQKDQLEEQERKTDSKQKARPPKKSSDTEETNE